LADHKVRAYKWLCISGFDKGEAKEKPEENYFHKQFKSQGMINGSHTIFIARIHYLINKKNIGRDFR
jgi:hypothetical protein